jgi:hypothetical protein
MNNFQKKGVAGRKRRMVFSEEIITTSVASLAHADTILGPEK